MKRYKPKHFMLEELVSKIAFEQARADILWFAFDERILITIERIRRRYGKMLVNTWYWGGEHQYRGYRSPGCLVGATLSQHRFGRAIDLEPISVSTEEIRHDILGRFGGKPSIVFEYVTAVELDTPWLHIDCRNHIKETNGILTFKPKYR